MGKGKGKYSYHIQNPEKTGFQVYDSNQNFLVDSISISIIKELNKFISSWSFLSCKFSMSWDEFDLI